MTRFRTLALAALIVVALVGVQLVWNIWTFDGRTS